MWSEACFTSSGLILALLELIEPSSVVVIATVTSAPIMVAIDTLSPPFLALLTLKMMLSSIRENPTKVPSIVPLSPVTVSERLSVNLYFLNLLRFSSENSALTLI